MGKRLRKARTMCCCVSPRTSLTVPHSIFQWYEQDVWTEIAKYLDGRSLVMLASTSKWFFRIMSENCIWKYACLRDLEVSDPGNVDCKWTKLYASAFDGSHSFMFRHQEKYIDWMRIGAFSLNSDAAFLTENLIAPLNIPKLLECPESGCCVVQNIKTGVWIADLQLARCPVCDLDDCDGTMQILDARHIELFSSKGFQDGSWDYEELKSYNTQKKVDQASCGIFDIKHLKDKSTSVIFNLKSWAGRKNEMQPKSVISSHAVAVNTNLQENDGVQIKFHGMKAGKDGKVISRVNCIKSPYFFLSCMKPPMFSKLHKTPYVVHIRCAKPPEANFVSFKLIPLV